MFIAALDKDPSGHEAVTNATDFRALDIELAFEGRLKPSGDYSSRNRVLLEAEDGHREIMEHVNGFQLVVVSDTILEVEFVDLVNIVGSVQTVHPARGGRKSMSTVARSRARFAGVLGRILLDVVPNLDCPTQDEDVANRAPTYGEW